MSVSAKSKAADENDLFRANICFKMLPGFGAHCFGVGTICLSMGALHGPNNELPQEQNEISFLSGLDCGRGRPVLGMRRVKADASRCDAPLRVEFFNELSFSFIDVKGISENHWINICPVAIHLKATTPFGELIRFMPNEKIHYWCISGRSTGL